MIDFSSAFHKNGLCFLTEEKIEHSALYLKVRQAEHRVLSDEQVSKLPKTEKNHSLAKDWKLRSWSSCPKTTNRKQVLSWKT